MNVDDIVAEKIAAARRRAEEAKRRRAALNAARQRGLAHRHAQRLRNQAAARTDAEEPKPAADPITDACICTVAERDPACAAPHDDFDDVVTVVSEVEWHDGVRTALARLGLTYAELEDQARRRDFISAQAQVLWVSIGGTVNTELLEENQ
ncbi:hypothetical protein [Streptomyces sp. NPDC056628]|uniref:hypothetical protein n=1 Tax=Streptomyces sp. NPDC056628 TaxID=3345882 RepID=UPI0036A43ADC